MFFTKRNQLERQLMEEIKSYAGVKEFPYEDAKVISDFLVAYNKGNDFIDFAAFSALDTIDKYPNLSSNWYDLLIKYKKLGLFPKWKIVF